MVALLQNHQFQRRSTSLLVAVEYYLQMLEQRLLALLIPADPCSPPGWNEILDRTGLGLVQARRIEGVRPAGGLDCSTGYVTTTRRTDW
jgi:hypothetical protein